MHFNARFYACFASPCHYIVLMADGRSHQQLISRSWILVAVLVFMHLQCIGTLFIYTWQMDRTIYQNVALKYALVHCICIYRKCSVTVSFLEIYHYNCGILNLDHKKKPIICGLITIKYLAILKQYSTHWKQLCREHGVNESESNIKVSSWMDKRKGNVELDRSEWEWGRKCEG